jgi:hypothetical protein
MLRQMMRLTRPASIGLAGALLMLSSPAAKAEWPSLLEAKDIAEEGFIYGLPIVMNYAVMHEYAVDRDSGQFKAPFNEIKNEARVFTDKDTAIVTPNSDTPYSFAGLDLRAEPIVLSVPAVEKAPQPEKERGWLADDLHPEGFARNRQGIELAACT